MHDIYLPRIANIGSELNTIKNGLIHGSAHIIEHIGGLSTSFRSVVWHHYYSINNRALHHTNITWMKKKMEALVTNLLFWSSLNRQTLKIGLPFLNPIPITPFMRMTQVFFHEIHILFWCIFRNGKMYSFLRRGNSFSRFADGRIEKSLKLVCAMLI